jgi:PAS domain S-box-containing protein
MLDDLWQREESDLLGKKLLDVFPELKNQKYPQVLSEVFFTGRSKSERESLAYVQGKNGLMKFYVDYDYTPLFDIAGEVSGLIITVNDVTERVEARKKLEESEKRFRLLADSMPQFVWSGDKDGNLNYFNASVYSYTGLNPEEVKKNGWLQIVHPDEREENIEAWTDSIKTGNDFSFEHRFRRNDGVYRWQLSRAVPLRDVDGNIQMWVGTSTDIHDQMEFTNELEKQVQERTTALAQHVSDLAKMNKELQSFAYISSHDLQEPLRKIQLFASNIQRKEYENLSETGRETFNRILNSAERMQLLIRDLLTYSRTNTAERTFEKTDLNKIIEQVLDDLKEEIHHAHVKLVIPDMCVVNIIPFQFRQLFYNLISNAIKFSHPEKPPHIEIKNEMNKGSRLNNEQLNQDVTYCHISVSDNGIGFEKQYREKIFELFQRLHGKDEYEGTGIGLAIVKKIVENHNGMITAKGESGEGATFDIYIPVA